MGANVVRWSKLLLLGAGWGSKFGGNEWCHIVPTCVEHDKTIGSPCAVISDTPYCTHIWWTGTSASCRWTGSHRGPLTDAMAALVSAEHRSMSCTGES